MPRDQRLYMTYPIDFHRHPKLTRLPVEVRWTFVEMNGEARLAENDGVFDVAEAEFMWPADHLDQLTRSHPTRPLVVRDGDSYVIRDYAEHQFTKADRDGLTQKRSEAGKAGAAKRWQNNGNPIASAKQMVGKPKLGTEIGTGTGTEIDLVSHVIETKRLSDSEESNPGTLIPDDWRPNQQHVDKANALHLDVKREYERFRSHAQMKQRRMKNWNAAFTNWLKQGAVMAQQRQGHTPPSTTRQAPQSKAALNAARYRQEFGDEYSGSMEALDAGFSA